MSTQHTPGTNGAISTLARRTKLFQGQCAEVQRALETHADLLAAAQAVLASWESGDLAAAVRELDAAVEQAVQS